MEKLNKPWLTYSSYVCTSCLFVTMDSKLFNVFKWTSPNPIFPVSLVNVLLMPSYPSRSQSPTAPKTFTTKTFQSLNAKLNKSEIQIWRTLYHLIIKFNMHKFYSMLKFRILLGRFLLCSNHIIHKAPKKLGISKGLGFTMSYAWSLFFK